VIALSGSAILFSRTNFSRRRAGQPSPR